MRDLAGVKIPAAEEKLGRAFAGQQFEARKAIMGIFDEGCMGMFNVRLPSPMNCCIPLVFSRNA